MMQAAGLRDGEQLSDPARQDDNVSSRFCQIQRNMVEFDPWTST